MWRLARLRRRAVGVGGNCPALLDESLNASQQLIADLKNAMCDVREAEAQTARWRSRAELAQRQYQDVLALLPVPYLRTDCQSTILSLNEPAACLLNLSPPYAIGKPFSLFIAANRDNFIARLAEIRSGRRLDNWPLEIQPRERRRAFVMATAYASNHSAGDESINWILHLREGSEVKPPGRAHR